GDHLQVDFPGPRSKPILLLGHLDTVYPLGAIASMPFRQDKRRAYGPGVFDMKAGIVMMEFAIGALRDRSRVPHPEAAPAAEGWERKQLLRPITLLLTTDEEVGSATSRALIEKLAKKSAAVFVCEPAQGPPGALKTARKG